MKKASSPRPNPPEISGARVQKPSSPWPTEPDHSMNRSELRFHLQTRQASAPPSFPRTKIQRGRKISTATVISSATLISPGKATGKGAIHCQVKNPGQNEPSRTIVSNRGDRVSPRNKPRTIFALVKGAYHNPHRSLSSGPQGTPATVPHFAQSHYATETPTVTAPASQWH